MVLVVLVGVRGRAAARARTVRERGAKREELERGAKREVLERGATPRVHYYA